MSFDLALWDPAIGLKSNLYVKLCEGQLVPLRESGSVRGSYDELIKQWPEIDTIPEERVGDFAYSNSLSR